MRNYLMFSFFFLSLIFTNYANADVEEYGTASYYSDKFQGRKTASGELYDKNKLTGAHKSLKFGTIILVTRLDNKKSVKVRINDRGPYIKGRIVDVSRMAAEKLGLIKDGHAEVKIEVVGEKSENISPPSPNSPLNLSDLKKVKAPKKVADEPIPTEFSNKSMGLPKSPPVVSAIKDVNEKPTKRTVPDLKVPAKKVPVAKPVATETVYTKVRGSDFKTYDLYKIQLVRPARTGFGVQVASLSHYENVMMQVAELQENWFNNILVSVERGNENGPIYKLILGPFPDRATAESYKLQLKKNKKIEGFVVDLSVEK
jgi:peptidoglycan lytic transglycosylase